MIDVDELHIVWGEDEDGVANLWGICTSFAEADGIRNKVYNNAGSSDFNISVGIVPKSLLNRVLTGYNMGPTASDPLILGIDQEIEGASDEADTFEIETDADNQAGEAIIDALLGSEAIYKDR